MGNSRRLSSVLSWSSVGFGQERIEASNESCPNERSVPRRFCEDSAFEVPGFLPRTFTISILGNSVARASPSFVQVRALSVRIGRSFRATLVAGFGGLSSDPPTSGGPRGVTRKSFQEDSAKFGGCSSTLKALSAHCSLSKRRAPSGFQAAPGRRALMVGSWWGRRRVEPPWLLDEVECYSRVVEATLYAGGLRSVLSLGHRHGCAIRKSASSPSLVCWGGVVCVSHVCSRVSGGTPPRNV